MKYAIVCEVKGKNPGTEPKTKGKKDGSNESGVIVYVQNISSGYSNKEEIARVAFVRANSSNKRVAFKTQLKKVVADANAAIEIINDQDEKLTELKSKAGELQ